MVPMVMTPVVVVPVAVTVTPMPAMPVAMMPMVVVPTAMPMDGYRLETIDFVLCHNGGLSGCRWLHLGVGRRHRW